ncbi:hypothetical protein AB0I60_10735 [Actinosynnema sp. NPDC050436]|uniref:hypothetical protein n=1 Tax=Actinosynnema sp. NPDC050436 TaxID=3155659 RepID=UPI0033CB1768
MRREAGAATEAADRAQQAAEHAARAIDAAESATDRLDQILHGTPVPGDRSPRG